MAIQANDVIRVTALMRYDDAEDIANVYHWRVAVRIPADDDTDVITAIRIKLNVMYDDINDYIHDSVEYRDINIFNVTQGLAYGNFTWPSLTGGGDTAWDSLPSQIGAFVRGLSGYTRNWAKKWLGPLGEDACDPNGQLAAAAFATLVTFGGDWVTPFTAPAGTTLEPVVWHTSANVYRRINEIALTNTFGTQRRRRRGAGS